MKALVLFSGGLDSTTILAMAVEQYGSENVIALSMRYGQKHEKEIQCAKDIVKHYGVEHIEYDMSNVFKFSECTLLKGNEKIPTGSYAEQRKGNEKPVSTYVPYRNGVFLSVATSIAISLNCDTIYYGAHKDDASNEAYPDCSEDFNDYISQAIWCGSGKQVKIIAPFIDKTKADIVKKGIELNVPYEKTWSCYEGGDIPCGKCATCIDREKAFKINGKEDPLYDKVGE